jgi:hypothetical protein
MIINSFLWFYKFYEYTNSLVFFFRFLYVKIINDKSFKQENDVIAQLNHNAKLFCILIELNDEHFVYIKL